VKAIIPHDHPSLVYDIKYFGGCFNKVQGNPMQDETSFLRTTATPHLFLQCVTTVATTSTHQEQ
jgi:hypothetical protein